ncbi:MAG: DJ-1/PfpI family protein [Pseudobacteriovorax sp.]|nr:DJ-1/PfpI family protein [Pseudobacteriovorax sp.]
MVKILFAMPEYGFDPSEVAIPWRWLKKHGVEMEFATPSGRILGPDRITVSGKGLGLFKPMLRASSEVISCFDELKVDASYQNPRSLSQVQSADFDGIILPGGHAPEMRPYLESSDLYQLIHDFFEQKKLVATICHGVVGIARTKNPNTGDSWLYDYKVTALLKSQETLATVITKPLIGNHYRTYPETVQDEVTKALQKPEQFVSGPLPMIKDSWDSKGSSLVVRDRNLITSRWPGDAHSFAKSVYEYLS